MVVLMLDVGDGLALNIDKKIQIDFGGDEESFKLLFRFFKMCEECYYCPFWWKWGLKPEVFILSHFHEDHYKGLFFNVAKSYFCDISQIYYPAIPVIEDERTSQEFFICLLSIMEYFIHYSLGRLSGFPAVDLITIFRTILGRKPKYSPLVRGMTIKINTKEFEVLWPPKEIKEKQVVGEVKKAIETFKIAMGENRKLREYFEKYNEILPKYILEKNDFDEYLDYIEEEKLTMKEKEVSITSADSFKITPEIEQANKLLRKAANRMSLVLRDMNNEILFMGDLENKETDIICKDLIDKNLTKFKIIIPPHHGTHFSSKMKQLSSDVILVSCGAKLKKYIKPKLKDMCKHVYSTYDYGNLYFSTINVSICFSKVNYN